MVKMKTKGSNSHICESIRKFFKCTKRLYPGVGGGGVPHIVLLQRLIKCMKIRKQEILTCTCELVRLVTKLILVLTQTNSQYTTTIEEP